MSGSNGLFRLFEYEFEDPENYNSLRLVQQRCYSLEDTDFTRRDLLEVWLRALPDREEPHIAFPQANSLARVVNLCELLEQQPLTPGEITAIYDFNERQTGYYTAAGRYLESDQKRRPRLPHHGGGPPDLETGYRQRQAALCG